MQPGAAGSGSNGRRCARNVIKCTNGLFRGMANHLRSEMGEIGENVPNEANCDEVMSSIQPHDPIQVTANSDAISGLDKGVAQPGEGNTPEQGKAYGLIRSRSGSPCQAMRVGTRLRASFLSMPCAASRTQEFSFFSKS